jgi:hypothetical protein
VAWWESEMGDRQRIRYSGSVFFTRCILSDGISVSANQLVAIPGHRIRNDPVARGSRIDLTKRLAVPQSRMEPKALAKRIQAYRGSVTATTRTCSKNE